jgi:hypothetical protein
MTIRGEVSGFQQRSEQVTVGNGTRFLYVWDFRIEQKDAAGKPMPRAAVEMRGTSFSGSLANGDMVEIEDSFESGKLLTPGRVRNLTSGIFVKARGESTLRWSKWISILVFLIFVAVAVGVFVAFSGFAQQQQRNFQQQHRDLSR